MAARLRVKEVAQMKGMSMGKLPRAADVLYKMIKRIYSDPLQRQLLLSENLQKSSAFHQATLSKKYRMILKRVER